MKEIRESTKKFFKTPIENKSFPKHLFVALLAAIFLVNLGDTLDEHYLHTSSNTYGKWLGLFFSLLLIAAGERATMWYQERKRNTQEKITEHVAETSPLIIKQLNSPSEQRANVFFMVLGITLTLGVLANALEDIVQYGMAQKGESLSPAVKATIINAPLAFGALISLGGIIKNKVAEKSKVEAQIEEGAASLTGMAEKAKDALDDMPTLKITVERKQRCIVM